MKVNVGETKGGRRIVRFNDARGNSCSAQGWNNGQEAILLLGRKGARMALTRNQLAVLLPHLMMFAAPAGALSAGGLED